MMKYGERRPVAANDAFVAPNATVVGRVELRDEASIWNGAVVRGDHADVSIGSVANVQDRAVIETVSTLESGFPASVTVGDYTSVGAAAAMLLLNQLARNRARREKRSLCNKKA